MELGLLRWVGALVPRALVLHAVSQSQETRAAKGSQGASKMYPYFSREASKVKLQTQRYGQNVDAHTAGSGVLQPQGHFGLGDEWRGFRESFDWYRQWRYSCPYRPATRSEV